ncbi:MBL fold metallo-hydrolase [Flavobacterium seoulense]|uniref:Beta-lactamase n=1 Tax=Flavobacterium seoulense TaxID=1492738 RepID=A0A066WT40_9FLAO|nr:MBL fold metallo-hydrolase [Flavobacterium seoulense]KDN55733.1 beta-lactamase [Flavobacterium seoulense]
MKIEQIYTGCLAQGAYYITSNGEAAIIDPLREVQPYINRLERDGVKLKYIFETHFHADFVSGHLDLSKKTEAPIVFGPTADPEFKTIIATDGQEFKIGNITLKALHTPGHTMESTCYLLLDENRKEHALFSGDTLFVGDVGRPDLAQKAAHMTQEELAATLFHSLRNKIMPLPDDVILYPAHGAGSSCGKNIGKETVSTIGEQKESNYALRANMTEAEFVKELIDGLLPPPDYFKMNVAMNKEGYENFETILNHGMIPIPVNDLEAVAEKTNAVILDTRKNSKFAKGFIPQSINIGIDGDFAPWVGTLIADVKQPIILVTEKGKEEESVTRLSRVGFDNVIGHLKGGFKAWKKADRTIDTIDRISARKFTKELKITKNKVIDVRKEDEFCKGHVQGAHSKPLAYINDWINDINPKEEFYIHCTSGYRSMIAASILQARGFSNFKEVEGGFKAIEKTSVPKTDFECEEKPQNK